MGYVLLIAALFLAELGIKNHMEKKLSAGEERRIGNGCILLRKYHNRGAFLDLGEKKSGLVAALSVILTAGALAVFLFSLGRRGNGLLRLGMALLLGGAFSNTYDRLRRKYVVDYFSFPVKWKRLRSVVFNLADFCILFGALLAVLGKES